MSVTPAEEAARRMIDEYNKGSPDWVERCHADNTVWTEHPIPGMTSGRGGGRSVLRQAAEQACANFPDRRMKLVSLTAQEDRAAMELDWTGTVAAPGLGRAVGDKVRLRIAMFIVIAGGRIVRQTDYCLLVPSS